MHDYVHKGGQHVCVFIVGGYCVCRRYRAPPFPQFAWEGALVSDGDWGGRGLSRCTYWVHLCYTRSTEVNSGLCLSQLGDWEYPGMVSRQRWLNIPELFSKETFYFMCLWCNEAYLLFFSCIKYLKLTSLAQLLCLFQAWNSGFQAWICTPSPLFPLCFCWWMDKSVCSCVHTAPSATGFERKHTCLGTCRGTPTTTTLLPRPHCCWRPFPTVFCSKSCQQRSQEKWCLTTVLVHLKYNNKSFYTIHQP